MSDNLQKLVGLVAMTVLVVLGVVLTNDDDTDFSRNRSFRETAGTFAGADRVEADCCDQTLALLGSMQTQLTQISSQLQIDLSEESESSTIGTSPDLQEIADQMAETCPVDMANLPMIWNSTLCVRKYLTGFPIELAQQVVLTHGKFGFFHRWNFDLAGENWNWDPADPIWTSSIMSELSSVTTGEACGPIFYGYNPPPRVAIAVDTYQGVVLPKSSQFFSWGPTGYYQELLPAYEGSYLTDQMHWPTQIEQIDLCQ